MAYIGKSPVSGQFSKQALTTDGSTTTFALDYTIGSTTSIIVSVGGVLQNPGVGYTLSGGGTSIVFTAAPASTDTTYIQFLGTAIVQNLTDVNGVEFILDADADTTLTADTDDEIDIKVGGTDRSTIKATGYHNVDSVKFVAGTSDDMQIYHDGSNSYITNAVGALKIATETSGIAITIGHSTSEITIADNMTVAGDLTVTGTTSFADTNITNVGSIALDTITNDGTDITLDSSDDIVIDAAGGNIEFKDAGTLQLTLDMDTTAGVQIVKLGVDSDDLVFQQYDGNEVIRINDDRKLYFYDDGGENISSDGTDFTFASGNDINLTATTDINIPANVGLTFGNDAEKIEGDGTDLTIAGNNINLTAVADVNIPSGVGLTFATAEKIESDGTDLSITVGSSGDINVPADIGVTFGNDGEKIEGDGTDLTIAGNNINLTAVADVVIPANVGITFGTGEKIEGDSTDLTVTSGGAINLTATTDVVIPANVGITFGSGEKIEGDSTDLTVTSGAKINLTATSDVHIPNNVGIVFGGDSEKIEGDGTDLTISANNLTVDAAADIILDAAGNNVIFKSGGTSILDISNSSSDAVITASVQDKDIIFKGDDGGSAVTALTLDMSAGGIATFSAAANVAQAALTSTSNAVAWDASAKPNAYHLTTENTTIAAPTNAVEGAFVCLEINHDGSYTVGWNTIFEFAASTEPTTTDTNAKTDLFVFRYNGAIWQEVGRTLNLSES
jgi:hypothetical protein